VLIGAAFWWAVFAGQFDDAGQAGRSILEDDDSPQAQDGGQSEESDEEPG